MTPSLTCDARTHTRTGKLLSIDQFVLRRSECFVEQGRLVLPAVEIVYLFNGFGQMPQETREAVLQQVRC